MTEGAEPVVVDTNVLFSALLDVNTIFAQQIFASGHDYFVCESTLSELFRHKEKLLRRTRLDDTGLGRLYYLLLKRVQVYNEDRIPAPCWSRACDLCSGLDMDDAPQVALTLALDGVLWTGDKALKARLMAKGFDRFFTP